MLWTIHEAAARLRDRKLTAVALLEHCLEQIDRYESRVHAWVFVDREAALEQARGTDAEISRGHWRGALHGIPIGIKDIIDVFDLPTAAGSKLWAQSIARHDAPVVSKLREAGAVILGKTHTTQFASFDPSPTRNPWNLERTPGGSSSGTAAAVACGMCLGALGSQTGGSITRPASYCGVPSLKPSYGRVDVAGVVPLAPTMDHVGPMANCVRDLAILYQAIAAGVTQDPVPYLTGDSKPHRVLPFTFRPRDFFDARSDASVKGMMDAVCTRLAGQGVTIEDIALPAEFADVLVRHQVIMAVEASSYHGSRLRKHPEDYQPRIRGLVEEGQAAPATEYRKSLEHRKSLRRSLRRILQHGIFLTPATTKPAPDAATTGDPAFNSPWSYTGFPTVSIPSGWSEDGMPLSIQLVGAPGDEAELLAAALEYEEILALEKREPR